VLEYAPHNLVTYSEQFGSWSTAGGSVSSNTSASPDGTVTADTYTIASGGDYLYNSATVSASTTYTASIFVKAGTKSSVRLQYTVGGFADRVYIDINPSAGTIGSVQTVGIATAAAATIQSVGSGWYRVTLTGNLGSATTGYIAIGNDSGTGTVLLWGAQLAVGPYALDYTPTTNAAVYGPRFDYDGSGVTIVEPVSTNLVTYSEQFDNAGWTKTNATVTANTTTAPDGTVTADLMYPTTTGTYRATLQSNSGVSGQVYTASFYIKSAGFQWVSLMTSAGGNIGVYFDVINGVKGTESIGTGTITSVGNGWFRCTITTTASSSTIYSGVTVVDANNSITATTSGTSGVYIWGAQLEVGSTATAYMVSGASNGFRAVPVVSGSATAKGLLVEEQRQNLVTYSEQFDNAAWTKLNASVTANAATSPNGTVSADLLIPDTSSSNQHGVYQPLGATAGTPYTQSVFAKAAGYNWLFMTEGNNVTAQASFNLATGVVGTVSGTGSPSATITSLGNGWYRCTLTYTPIATSQNIQVRAANADAGPTFAGNGTSGIYIWGAQLE
jgi:hypothetical protein